MAGQMVRITVLVENKAQGSGLLAVHGLAFWLEAGQRNVLFDTGPGAALEHNARRLGIALESADAIVLSHGHYDHTGGLAVASRLAPQATIYAHPAAFERKYAGSAGGTNRDIGAADSEDRLARWVTHRLVHTAEPTEVCEGVSVTGAIPRLTDFEDTGGSFFLDGDSRVHDPLIDDQALFFGSSRGTVVLLGCAHAGVINTLRYVQELTGGRPIHTVVGGMHLMQASPERMEQTIEALRELDVERLGPAHCTGAKATAQLAAAFPGRCFSCAAGATMEFVTP